MATLLPEGKQSFTDGAGKPLVGGKLYTYDAGTSTPRPTYADAAGTIANTNPVVLDARGEATVFWQGAYKAVLKDASGVTVWTVDHVRDEGAALALDLLDTAPGKGAALVGYDSGTAQDVLDEAKPMANYTALRAYTGRATGVRITQAGLAGFFQRDDADTTSADNGGTIIVDASGRRWMRVFVTAVNVKWFGAVGDGVTDDTAAIQAAVAASNSIVVPPGNYYLDEYSSSNDVVFQLHNGTYNIQNIGDVTFTLRTATGTGDCFPVVFDLKGAGGSSFGKFRFRDLGYDDSTSNRRGLKAYRLTADGSTGSWGDVSIDRIQCNNCISPISFEGADSNNRVRGVHVSEIALENCYYGPLCQNQGDNFTVDVLSGSQVRRIYFVYGCKTHDVRIIDRNPKGSTGTINISRSAGGFNTEGLNIRYSCREASVANQLYANINHIDLLGGAIRGVRLHLDIDVPVAAVPLRFINYDGSGGNESTAASTNIVDDVVVTGTFGSTSSVIDTIASYGSRGYLDVTARNATIGAVTREAFMLENDEGTWTPVLVDSDLNTGEGQTASVAIGTFQKRGRVVTFTGRLRMTSLGSLNTSSVATISGLPYKSANVSNRIGSVTVFSASNLNLTAAAAIVGYVSQNNSIITLQKWSATTGTTGLAISEVSLDGELAFSGHYTV